MYHSLVLSLVGLGFRKVCDAKAACLIVRTAREVGGGMKRGRGDRLSFITLCGREKVGEKSGVGRVF